MEKLEIQNEVEQRMFDDFIIMSNQDFLHSLVIFMAKEMFANAKPILQNIINQWSAEYFHSQMKIVNQAYKDMKPEQLEKAVPLERHEKILGWCVNMTKMELERMFNMKKIIITN